MNDPKVYKDEAWGFWVCHYKSMYSYHSCEEHAQQQLQQWIAHDKNKKES